MTATVGRIVHYTLSAGDVAEIDKRQPQRDEATGAYFRNPVREGNTYPAVVVAVWGGPSVNLQVLLDGAGAYWATSRVEGEGAGQWAWPPRV